MKIVGVVIGVLLLIAGAFWWNGNKDAAYAAEKAKWDVQKRFDDSVANVRVEESYKAGLANARSIPIYLEGKTRIIREAAGTPGEQAVKACFEMADQRISACEASRKADSSVIDAQKQQIKTLEAKPERQLPRFQMYGAAGYSVRVDSSGTQMAPAFRAGIDSKLIGPIRLMTDGQLSLPGRGHATPLWQANVMGRINF